MPRWQQIFLPTVVVMSATFHLERLVFLFMLKYYVKTTEALKRLRMDQDGVASFEYVIVAACIIGGVSLRFRYSSPNGADRHHYRDGHRSHRRLTPACSTHESEINRLHSFSRHRESQDGNGRKVSPARRDGVPVH